MNQIATLWWSLRDVIWPRRFYNNNVKDKISGLKGFFPDLRRSFYSVIIPPAKFIKFAWDLSLMIYDIYSFNFD